MRGRLLLDSSRIRMKTLIEARQRMLKLLIKKSCMALQVLLLLTTRTTYHKIISRDRLSNLYPQTSEYLQLSSLCFTERIRPLRNSNNISSLQILPSLTCTQTSGAFSMQISQRLFKIATSMIPNNICLFHSRYTTISLIESQ